MSNSRRYEWLVCSLLGTAIFFIPFVRFVWDLWAQNFLFVFLSLLAFAALVTGRFSINYSRARHLPGLVFVVLFISSFLMSPFSESARYEAMLLLGALYLYGTVRGLSPVSKSILVKIIVASGSIFLALYCATAYSDSVKGLNARNELFINANMVGACSLLLFFAALKTLPDGKYYSIPAVLISLAALFFSQSVSSTLALGAGWVWLRWPEYSSSNQWRKSALPAIVLLAGAAYFLREYGADSVSDRGRWWMETARAIAAHPWLGNGPGSFQIFSAAFWTRGTHSQYAHNFLLQKASEMGLPAALLLSFIMIMLMVQCKERFLQAACGALLVQSLFDFSMQIPGIFLLYFCLTAISSDESSGQGLDLHWTARMTSALIMGVAVWFWGVKPAVAAHHAMTAEKEFENMDFAGAERSLRKSVRWDPDSGKYFSDLAQTLMARAESEPDGKIFLIDAESSLSEAMKRDPYSPIYKNQAQLLRHLAERSAVKK